MYCIYNFTLICNLRYTICIFPYKTYILKVQITSLMVPTHPQGKVYGCFAAALNKSSLLPLIQYNSNYTVQLIWLSKLSVPNVSHNELYVNAWQNQTTHKPQGKMIVKVSLQTPVAFRASEALK